MTHTQLLKSLKDTLKKSPVTEKELSARIMPLIARKIWATEPQFYLEMLKTETANVPKGRVMKADPEVKEYCTMMGLDKDGMLVYEERWEGHPARGYKKYFDNDGDTTRSYSFMRDGALDEVQYQKRTDGIPVAFGTYSRYAVNFADTYSYEGGRLARIDRSVVYLSTIQNPVYTVNYDGLDNIQDIIRTDAPSKDIPDGQHIIVYQRNTYSLKALVDIFTEETNAVIAKTLEGNNKQFLLIILDRAFVNDEWLPLKVCAIDRGKPFNATMPVGDLTDFEKLSPTIATSEKLSTVSRLLVQEITSQEKFDIPTKLLLNVAKHAKSLAGNTKVLALDLYDDYELSVGDILSKLYSKKYIGKM